MGELDSTGAVKVSYVSDPKGNPVSVRRTVNGSLQNFFYHVNAHGDVIAITDSGGNTVASFTYDAWGNPTEYNGATGYKQLIGSWTTPTGGTANDGLFFLFGSMLYDAATGLYLTKTRAYNPKTGRFLQRDILDESGKKGVYKGFPFGKDAIGTNLYAWCGNNPVSRVDPSGMLSFRDLIRGAIHVAQGLANIVVGIAAGLSGASSGNSGGAYNFGYGIGSGTRAAIKVASIARQVISPMAAKLTPIISALRTPSSGQSWYSGIANSVKNNWEAIAYGSGTAFGLFANPVGTMSQVGKSAWYFGSEFYDAIENEPASNPAFSNYHHYEANRKSCAQGPAGCLTALALGDLKEAYDQYRRPGDEQASERDYGVNRAGRIAGILGQSSPPHVNDDELDNWLNP
ncbi:MAG: RHS repeat domain-containing protein [Thermoleophilia bacterium]